MSFLKKYFKKNKRAVLKKEKHIRRDWLLSLLVFVVITIGFSLISFFIFLQINGEDTYEHESVINTERLIDQELLNKTIEINEDKRKAFIEYQEEGIDVPGL